MNNENCRTTKRMQTCINSIALRVRKCVTHIYKYLLWRDKKQEEIIYFLLNMMNDHEVPTSVNCDATK